jgi:hypothetical protein
VADDKGLGRAGRRRVDSEGRNEIGMLVKARKARDRKESGGKADIIIERKRLQFIDLNP